MKPILLELIPIILLGVGWIALKFYKSGEAKVGAKPSFLQRIKWENWVLMLIAAVALAYAISRAAL